MHTPTAATFTIVILTASVLLLTACSSSTWEDARQENTYEAYQDYIEANPEGEHVATAKNRADSLYWKTIENDTTAKSFETYLDRFPQGQFRDEAEIMQRQVMRSGLATEGRVTGSNIIIRSSHTTESPSAGVIARKGTIVEILDTYSSGNSSEAILRNRITVTSGGRRINLPQGKALRINRDLNDSVEASFTTPELGGTDATISKDDIEAMSGQRWYKIRTKDDITGWIYGKFLEEM